MAIKASFIPGAGLLSVIGGNAKDLITLSRDAAGRLLINGGTVSIDGGVSTVANTTLIQVFGQGGNDTITLDESNGALPAAHLFGGDGNDTLIGGSGNDQLFGGAGNDTLSARAATTCCSAATATTHSGANVVIASAVGARRWRQPRPVCPVLGVEHSSIGRGPRCNSDGGSG